MKVLLYAQLLYLICVSPTLANGAADEWRDLWTRCRVAVETARPFDSVGLQPVADTPEVEKDAERLGSESQRFWRLENGRFIVRDAARDQNYGIRRTCYVALATGANALTKQEMSDIARTFLVERAMLIAGRGHISNDPSPIYPMVSLGVGPTLLNPNGCTVLSALFFNIETNNLISFTGEQNRRCSDESRSEKR